MYFKLFKPQNWRERSAEARSHNRAVLPPQMGSRLFHSKEAARKGLLPPLIRGNSDSEFLRLSKKRVIASQCSHWRGNPPNIQIF